MGNAKNVAHFLCLQPLLGMTEKLEADKMEAMRIIFFYVSEFLLTLR